MSHHRMQVAFHQIAQTLLKMGISQALSNLREAQDSNFQDHG